MSHATQMMASVFPMKKMDVPLQTIVSNHRSVPTLELVTESADDGWPINARRVKRDTQNTHTFFIIGYIWIHTLITVSEGVWEYKGIHNDINLHTR